MERERKTLTQDSRTTYRTRRIFSIFFLENSMSTGKENMEVVREWIEHLSLSFSLTFMLVLTTPLGNALLVGVRGSGKQSVTHLASFCAGYEVFTISLCRGYGENEFREELKELFRSHPKRCLSSPRQEEDS